MVVQPVASVERIAAALLQYCRVNDWAGHDPYDALNSRLLRTVPVLDSKLPRLVLTQVLKRSPVDLRGLLLVPKTQNPKGLAVFLSALLKLSASDQTGKDIAELIHRIVELRSPDSQYFCWGYSFPWQTRTVVVPRGAPNLVCTIFAATGLLDAYESSHDSRLLEIAASAANYVVEELYWTSSDGAIASFAYPRSTERVPIHNANLLAAAFLCRVSTLTREGKWLQPALRAARYSAAAQQRDGSWFYGEASTQRWIDNFHTGYNLGALVDIQRYLGTTEFETQIWSGFQFYRHHFFRNDGAPRYFHNRTFPIDIHCVAQSIITLSTFRAENADTLRLARRVFEWAVREMWDPTGFFYYRVLRFQKIRIPYMRWSQAWMLLALSTLLQATEASTSS